MRQFIYFIVLLLFFSCGKGNLVREVVPIIERDLKPISAQQIPSAFSSSLQSNDIVFFGESHYRQEHQDLLVSLLPEFSENKYTVLYEEGMHCLNWIIEDYLNGDREEMIETILYFNETTLEGIKAHNETANQDKKIQFKLFDVNHWGNIFKRSLEEMELIIGDQILFDPLINSPNNSAAYVMEVENLYNTLINNESELRLELGDKWYDRIVDISFVEIGSSKFRRSDHNPDREQIMFENLKTFIEKNPGEKHFINTGMSHSQKKTYKGENITRIGEMMINYNSKTHSISVVSLKGTRRITFKGDNESYDLLSNASRKNIMKEIALQAGDVVSYLPLSDPIFSEEDFTISVSSNQELNDIPIGLMYDSFIILPESHVLKSFEKYHWE